MEAIVAEREAEGPFTGLHDLARRVEHTALNRRVLESLVAAGALDTLHPSRARHTEAVPSALESGARAQAERAAGQTVLFGDALTGAPGEAALPEATEWDRKGRLRREKEVLGFYLSEHPLDAYRDEILAVASGDTARLTGLPTGAEVRLLGVVSGVVRKPDKKGRMMGFVSVEDYAGSLECVLFADVFESARPFLEPDRVVLVRGRLDRRDVEGDPKIVVGEVIDFETKRAEIDHTLYVRIPLSGLDEARLERLGDVLSRYPGRGGVVLSLEVGTGRRVRIRSQRYRVGVHPDLLTELRGLFGEEAVRLGEATNGGASR